MDAVKKIKLSFMAIASAVMLCVCNIIPTVIISHAQGEYKVTANYVGGKLIVPSGESATLTQDEIKAKLTGVLYRPDGTPLSFPGTLPVTQVNVLRKTDWLTYLDNTDTITQAGVADKAVTVASSEFTVTTLGQASSIRVPVMVVTFDEEGAFYGAGQFPLICVLDSDSETVIDGLDYETIITLINELQGKVDALEGQGYTNLADTINEATLALDTDSLADAIINLEYEIQNVDAAIGALDETSPTYADDLAALNAKKDALTETKTALQSVQEELLSILRARSELTEAFNTVKEQYNKVQAELENLHATAGSDNIGYAGTYNGKPVVYINGKAFEYTLESGVEYTYLDDNGGEHTAIKYTTKEGFDFYITLDGIHVINSDGSITIFDETLPQTLAKADAMLAEISRELVEMQTGLNEFYTAVAEYIGDDQVTGSTSKDILANITESVRDLVTDYNAIKTDYVKTLKVINGKLTDEQILNLSENEVLNEISALKNKAQDTQDSIQKALTGKDVTDATRLSLEDLNKNISALVDKLETDEATIKALVAALGEEDPVKAKETALALKAEIDKLNAEIETLKGTNDKLAKENATLTKINEATQDAKTVKPTRPTTSSDSASEGTSGKTSSSASNSASSGVSIEKLAAADSVSIDRVSASEGSSSKTNSSSASSSTKSNSSTTGVSVKTLSPAEAISVPTVSSSAYKTTTGTTNNSAAYTTALNQLNSKISQLQSNYATLSSKVAQSGTGTTRTVTTSTPTTSNSSQISSLNSKISELSTKVAQLQSKQNSASTTTTPSTSTRNSSTTTTSRNSSSSSSSNSSSAAASSGASDEAQAAVIEVDDQASSGFSAAVEAEGKEKIDGEFIYEDGVDEQEEPEETDEPEAVDEPKPINVKGLIFVITLIAIVLGLAGFIIFKLFFKKPARVADLDELMEDDDEEYDFTGEEDGGFEDSADEDNGPEIDDSGDDYDYSDDEPDFSDNQAV